MVRFQKAHPLFGSSDSAQVGRLVGSHALLGQWDAAAAAQVNGSLPDCPRMEAARLGKVDSTFTVVSSFCRCCYMCLTHSVSHSSLSPPTAAATPHM